MRNPDIHIRLEPKLLRALKQEAKEQNQTVQHLIRKLITTRQRRKNYVPSDPFLDRFSKPTAYSRTHPVREYIDRFSRPRTTAEKHRPHKWWN